MGELGEERRFRVLLEGEIYTLGGGKYEQNGFGGRWVSWSGKDRKGVRGW